MNLKASVTLLNTRNLLSKKKNYENMTMRKKSHLLLSHKRMNRYLLDVGLCKHKRIVGGEYLVFRAYEAGNLNVLRLNSRVKWEKLTSVYLSPVSSNIKEKTVTSLYFKHESYSHPIIHPSVNICILKNLPESPLRGGFVLLSVLPMV